jgi:hypothetical protein
MMIPDFDSITVMDSIDAPLQPGLPGSSDPFANPLVGMAFQNFAVLKIGNVSGPSLFFVLDQNSVTSLTPFRSLMDPPNKKLHTSSVVMPKPT